MTRFVMIPMVDTRTAYINPDHISSITPSLEPNNKGGCIITVLGRDFYHSTLPAGQQVIEIYDETYTD